RARLRFLCGFEALASTSDWRRITISSAPTLISVPPYLLKMISSPSATSSSTRFPCSSRAPGPTARTRPRCGFSLAVSGRTIPLAVVSSSSRISTIKRSPCGFRFIAKALTSLDRWRRTGCRSARCTQARGVSRRGSARSLGGFRARTMRLARVAYLCGVLLNPRAEHQRGSGYDSAPSPLARGEDRLVTTFVRCPACGDMSAVPTCASCGAELQVGADDDQTWSDRDQTGSDQDQTWSDHDQTASESDQRSADADQHAADDDLAAGGDRGRHHRSALAREQSSRDRAAVSAVRDESAAARLHTGQERDRAAALRDRGAEGRDQLARLHDQGDA